MRGAGAMSCVNCDGPLLGGSLLYCTSRCEQEASYVRYLRLVLKDGRWRRPEVREAIRIRGVVVMNGGYPVEERAISELDRRVRAEAPERLSDDEERWPLVWRELQAERRARTERLPRPPSRGRPHLRLVKA
jgi:hypothetical protein